MHLIVIIEKRKEKKIELIFNIEKLKSSEIITFLKPYKDTAPNVGIDSKKDIFAASYLINFNNLAAEIVTPDLLTPGISEKICSKPTKSADLKLKLLSIFFSNLNLSE